MPKLVRALKLLAVAVQVAPMLTEPVEKPPKLDRAQKTLRVF
jgi:hypothetical protein